MRSITLAFAAGIAVTLVTSVVAQQFGGSRFPDVAQGTYFYDAVNRLAALDVITGYDTGRFGPHDVVTRGQTAVIIDRYDRHIIDPLRDQLQQIRSELGLGHCGDSVRQSGEECDDGNSASGDGCSADCLKEIACLGGRKLGEKFPAPDGCNTCTCTEGGIACTAIACVQRKCFSSAECPDGKICSVEEGDCRFPCPEGAACIQACAGVCVQRTDALCGNGICDDSESGFAHRTGAKYCPQDCPLEGPLCGNALCDEGEADEYHIGNDGPELLRRGVCPQDCEGALSMCEAKKNSIDALFEKNVHCTTDDDCTVYVNGCSPYLTCGKPVRTDALLSITANIIDYVEACNDSEPAVCAGCLPNTAVCLNSICSLSNAVQ